MASQVFRANEGVSEHLSSLLEFQANLTETTSGDAPSDELSRNALILYGSETGNAQDSAERIGLEMLRYRFRVRIVSMDAYSLVSQPSHGCLRSVIGLTNRVSVLNDVQKGS